MPVRSATVPSPPHGCSHPRHGGRSWQACPKPPLPRPATAPPGSSPPSPSSSSRSAPATPTRHRTTASPSSAGAASSCTSRGGRHSVPRFNYPNPPVMAVMLEPFALLPPVAGAMAWFALKALMAAGRRRWVFRLVEPPGRPFRRGPKAARSSLLALKPVARRPDARQRQPVHPVPRRRRAWTATAAAATCSPGCVLALAIACKVTPLLFVRLFRLEAVVAAARRVCRRARAVPLPRRRAGAAARVGARTSSSWSSWYELMVGRPSSRAKVRAST